MKLTLASKCPFLDNQDFDKKRAAAGLPGWEGKLSPVRTIVYSNGLQATRRAFELFLHGCDTLDAVVAGGGLLVGRGALFDGASS